MSSVEMELSSILWKFRKMGWNRGITVHDSQNPASVIDWLFPDGWDDGQGKTLWLSAQHEDLSVEESDTFSMPVSGQGEDFS